MLEPAHLHQAELEEKYSRALLKEENRYYYTASHYSGELQVTADDWYVKQRVSLRPAVEEKDQPQEMLGYMRAKHDREDDKVYALAALSFKSGSPTFARDFSRFLAGLIRPEHIVKVKWTVTVGNPAEKLYRKLCKRFGGRVVGTLKKDVRLPDGKLYDERIFEILREDVITCGDALIETLDLDDKKDRLSVAE